MLSKLYREQNMTVNVQNVVADAPI